MKMKKLPIGVSDFKNMVTGHYYYVDKTLFIKEVIDSGDTILLISRPRRFGKTLNISMLAYYYDCCPIQWISESDSTDNADEIHSPYSNGYLFDSFAISKAGEEYRNHLGNHPVIFLSFRGFKDSSWDLCWLKIKKLIRKEYARHYYLLESPLLLPHEKQYFQKMIDLEGDRTDYEDSLENLVIFLSRYYNKRAVVLIDEYDAPIHAGFNFDYYDEIINFSRNFLCNGLKDTDRYLEKGVLTGIMRVAKESIFSGLNNLGVYTVLTKKFSSHFGFTELELKTMLDDFRISSLYDRIQSWYNGYIFGGNTIYNPWSIINFLNDEEKRFRPYWIRTSDNQIVELLLSRGGKELKEELEWLIRGESIDKPIDENIILKDVPNREDFLWSFLLMGGYLKQVNERFDEISGRYYYSLSIPNQEVRIAYAQVIDRYFSSRIENRKLETMLKALIEGDIELFEKMLKKIVLSIFSYHDFGGEPEKVYHALVLGLLIWINGTHEIKSNRESGYGRYDIMIIPRDSSKTGYVIEFKSVDREANETVEMAVKSALKQIEDRQYETELIDRGVKDIYKLAIVFEGKEVFVKI